jgi:hypothetical protein
LAIAQSFIRQLFGELQGEVIHVCLDSYQISEDKYNQAFVPYCCSSDLAHFKLEHNFQ